MIFQELKKELSRSSGDLSDQTGIGRATIDTWKHRMKKKSVTMEKQIEILKSLGYSVTIQITKKSGN